MKLLSLFRKNRNRNSAIENQIKLRAEEFVISYGNNYDGLDYSLQSISVFDRLLKDFTSEWFEMNDCMRNELLTNASSYILWVAKQKYQGRFFWSEKYSQPVLVIGEPDYRIALMFWEYLHKYLDANGANIPHYFKQIEKAIKLATNGTDILIN